MSKSLYLFFKICLILFLNFSSTLAQSIPAGFPVFEEALRRKQLLGELDSSVSFNLRPLRFHFIDKHRVFESDFFKSRISEGRISRHTSKISYMFLPIRNSISFNSGRPYGWGNGSMIPNVGFQDHLSVGFSAKIFFLNIQFQPELIIAQNKAYQGYPIDFSPEIHRARFFSWNNGDFPERFGAKRYLKKGWGQSKVSLSLGAFETGISTENIWWGPGQFNGLIFSNNSQGFHHLTLNTVRPVQTFLGSFEGQLIMGRLEPSGLEPSQHSLLNNRYFLPLSEDWRYINGISISYQPKWIPGFSLGFNRTFQQYNENKDNSFRGWFPIFEVFTKASLFEDGNTMDYDQKAQDQQVSLFGRYLFQESKAELYFEYGKRDHSLNWREFILNPEHARAYLLGFSKLFSIPGQDKFIQVRGEMTHQQESVNRYIRYMGLGGKNSWHTHYQVRGFTNFGQPLGVGAGVGSNVQTLEVSLVDNINKFGLRLERLANHQDFYYRAFGQQKERQPWVDLSAGLLFDYHWESVIVSSKLQLIHALNYQWQLDDKSTPDFPLGKSKLSLFAEAHLIFLLHP